MFAASSCIRFKRLAISPAGVTEENAATESKATYCSSYQSQWRRLRTRWALEFAKKVKKVKMPKAIQRCVPVSVDADLGIMC